MIVKLASECDGHPDNQVSAGVQAIRAVERLPGREKKGKKRSLTIRMILDFLQVVCYT